MASWHDFFQSLSRDFESKIVFPSLINKKLISYNKKICEQWDSNSRWTSSSDLESDPLTTRSMFAWFEIIKLEINQNQIQFLAQLGANS